MVRYHAPPNQMHHTFRLATFSEFLVDLYNAIVRKLLRYREYEGVKITYQEEYQILSNRIETYARKEFSERLTEPSVITSNHPLYIFTALSHTKCYRQHHRVEPRGMVAKLVKGAHQINLPTHYCTECQKHFIGSHTLSVYEKNFGPIIIEKHRLSEYDDSFNTFRMESKLHQLGYNVIDGRLTEEERHNILTSILESGQMSYFSIVSIIEQNVQMFKNSDQHILAVQKWRKDLRFLGDFLLSEDNKD